MKEKITIIITNPFLSSTDPFILTFNVKAIKIFLFSTSFFILLTTIFLIFSFLNNLNPDSIEHIFAQKNFYLSSLRSNYRVLEQDEKILEKFVDYEKKLRILSNMNPLSEDIRQLGLGGYKIEDKRFDGFDKNTKEFIEDIDFNLLHTKNLVQFEKKNLHNVKEELQKQYDLIKRTPSIFPTKGKIMSGFGPRIDPFKKTSEFHYGVDIANHLNTPIESPADGEVIFADYLQGYGKTLKIDHGSGYITVYAHLNSFNVRVGDKVKRHQVIAYMGSTGRSTGSHLHYEVRIGNNKINPIDYIDADTIIE